MNFVLSAAGIALVLGSALANPGSAQSNPMDSITKLPSYRPTHDTIPLLSDKRIDSLPASRREQWKRYIDRSRARYTLDTIARRAELTVVGKSAMVRAPYVAGFDLTDNMMGAWFASDSAQTIAQNILSFQAPNGGWSKHIDVIGHRRAPGQSFFSESDQWQWISTIDNSATTSEMRFLALADSARPNPEYRAAFLRGVDYVLAAQFPNGCWPQVWPLEGSYHDAATFNDDATLNATKMLKQVGDGKIPFAPQSTRVAAKKAVAAAVQCMVDAQVKVNGNLTVWGQQHDPLTLAPTSARSYELTSLTAQESANTMNFLMGFKKPSDAVVQAVHAAADWLDAVKLFGFKYGFDTGLEPSPGSGPLWARMYEIGSNRAIFSDRNGIKLYDWNQLNDRRHGYGWYTYAPVRALAKYKIWAIQHPRQR